MRNGVEDSIIHYNFNNMQHPLFFQGSGNANNDNQYPPIVQDHLSQVAEYYRYLHNDVLRKLCNLTDIVLELPEGFIWDNYYKVTPNDYKILVVVLADSCYMKVWILKIVKSR